MPRLTDVGIDCSYSKFLIDSLGFSSAKRNCLIRQKVIATKLSSSETFTLKTSLTGFSYRSMFAGLTRPNAQKHRIA